MNGLFSRLAEQSINQRETSVKPLRMPQFLTESTGALDYVDDHHQESVQDSVLSESLYPLAQPGIQRVVDVTNEAQSDASVHANNRPLSAKPHLVFPYTAQKHQAKKNNVSKCTSDQDTVADNDTLETPIIQPQIQNQTATVIKDKNPLEPTDEGANSKRFHLLTLDSAVILPQPLVTPTSEKFSAMVTRRNGGNQVPDTQNKPLSETEMTTINVSIGQIDIKATSSETPTIKKTHQSNRKFSISLDDYQQKRQRGER